jgi:peptidyl-prolyl cis-trans isomerase SurA
MFVCKDLAMTNTHRSRACLILALGLFVSPIMLGAEIIEQILVKVNGEIFTKTDLETRQVQAMRQRGIQLDPKNDPTDAQLRQALNTVTPQVMVEAVSEMLLVQRGKELGYKLADEQFKQIVDNIRKENKLDTDEKFQAALKQENMTVADLRRQVERSILVQRVESVEVFGKVAIGEDEARRYYDGHLAEFTTAAAVTLRELLVAVPADKASDAAQDGEARAKADDLRARAVAGENYMKLAEDFSDAPSKANAGLIGPISMSDLSPELRKVIEPMKNGEVSPVIRTPRGYQIFKIETLSASQTMPFEQAREQISDRIATGKRKDEFDKYLAKLRAQAIIEWKNPDVKKAFEEGLAEQAKQAKLPAQ